MFLRENPVPMIIGALAAGLVIGLAIRYASRSDEKEVEIKTPLGRIDLADHEKRNFFAGISPREQARS